MKRKNKKVNKAQLVQITVRLRESLRARLAGEAKNNRTSMNSEIATRLKESFQRDILKNLEETVRYMRETISRIDDREGRKESERYKWQRNDFIKKAVKAGEPIDAVAKRFNLKEISVLDICADYDNKELLSIMNKEPGGPA